MTMRPRVLAVTPTALVADHLLHCLTSAGYCTRVLVDFATAKAELDSEPPDLLIAEIRLGAYNGLHLAIRARARGLATPAIVIGDPDAVLEAEAEQHSITYLRSPLDEARFVATVRELLLMHRPARRFPRKRVRRLPALVNGERARIVEISYEGVRVEIACAGTAPLPQYFMLQLPAFNVACRVRRVWMDRPLRDRALLRCGAALATSDPAAAVAWRSLVDTVPGWTAASN